MTFHYVPAHPRVGVPVILAGLLLWWFGYEVFYLWPHVSAACFVVGFFTVIIGLGIAAPSSYETDWRGRTLPPRDSHGRFTR